MAIQYLFNSSGKWIAYREAKNVFDTKGEWVGWLPWDDADVVSPEGKYLGTICDGNRFYHLQEKVSRAYQGYPGYPSSPGALRFLGTREQTALPQGAQEVILPGK